MARRKQTVPDLFNTERERIHTRKKEPPRTNEDLENEILGISNNTSLNALLGPPGPLIKNP